MGEAKHEGGGSWWATLPGVLTGVAAVLTALGGLIAVVSPYLDKVFASSQQSRPAPERPSEILPAPQAVAPPLPAPQRVDEVWISNLEVRRSSSPGTTSLELYYRVSTGADFSPHDPSRFVKLVLGQRLVVPSWAPPAINVPPRSQQDVMVRFNTSATSPVVFRFGEAQPLDISIR